MSKREVPEYYQFGDIEAADILKHLTGLGSQIGGYIVRSCRMDGKNKCDNPREDLLKARNLIDMEDERLAELGFPAPGEREGKRGVVLMPAEERLRLNRELVEKFRGAFGKTDAEMQQMKEDTDWNEE